MASVLNIDATSVRKPMVGPVVLAVYFNAQGGTVKTNKAKMTSLGDPMNTVSYLIVPHGH